MFPNSSSGLEMKRYIHVSHSERQAGRSSGISPENSPFTSQRCRNGCSFQLLSPLWPQQFWAHRGWGFATSATLCLQPHFSMGRRGREPCLQAPLRLQGPRQKSTFPAKSRTVGLWIHLLASELPGANTGDHKPSWLISTWLCILATGGALYNSWPGSGTFLALCVTVPGWEGMPLHLPWELGTPQTRLGSSPQA